jgi:hypothetical protein
LEKFMKTFIAIIASTFALTAFAAEPAKKEEAKPAAKTAAAPAAVAPAAKAATTPAPAAPAAPAAKKDEKKPEAKK